MRRPATIYRDKMAEGNNASPKDIEKEKEPGQPLVFGDFSLPPLGPDAPEGLEPLMRQYLEQAAQNENVGQQMVAWAKRQNTPAPQELPPRVAPADGGKLAALQTAAQHIQGRNYTGSPTKTGPTFHGQRIPPSAAPGMFHPTPVDRALNPYFNPYGNTWRDPQQPPPAASYFGGQRGEFDPFRRAASHMSVDTPTPQPPPPDPRLAQVEARLEELTRMMNAANLHSHPPTPPRGRDDSMQPMQTETPQEMELQRKERERFERAIHQAYKATPAFCPDEEDYSDWIEQTWVRWSTCGLDMELYELDRSKDQALKKLLYNCLTIKPPGEKSCPNLTFLIGMNPSLDLAGDSFPQYYRKLMVQFASPDRQLQAAAEFDLRKQERTEEPAMYAADKLKLWYKSNPNAGANNTRAFLHAAINGLLNKEVRRRLFELGPSITLSNWVTTVQSVSMTVWTLFYENVGPEGVSGSGLSVGRKNVLSLKKQVVMAVNEAVPPEESDASDLDNAEGLAGVGEMIEEENEVYAVNQSSRSRGRCFDCGSLTHFQNSPKCQEKGARKFHPSSTPNNNLKKLTYQTPGDNKSANQVIYRKKNNFSSAKTKGRPSPGRANSSNRRKVRYVQVVEEGESTANENNSATDSEEDREETVANIAETPICYGWSQADEKLLGQSIFEVTTPISAIHTTLPEENKENEKGETVPRGSIRDSRPHTTDLISNKANFCFSQNQLSALKTTQDSEEEKETMEEGNHGVSDNSGLRLVPLAQLTQRAVRITPKVREIRPKPVPTTPLPVPAAITAESGTNKACPPLLIPTRKTVSSTPSNPKAVNITAPSSTEAGTTAAHLGPNMVRLIPRAMEIKLKPTSINDSTATVVTTADVGITRADPPPRAPLEVAGDPVLANTLLGPVNTKAPARNPTAVNVTGIDPLERPPHELSLKERTASVARLQIWKTSFCGEKPPFHPEVPPPGPGMPLGLGRDPFQIRQNVANAAPPSTTLTNAEAGVARPNRLQISPQSTPLTRTRSHAPQGAEELLHRPHPSKVGRGRGRGRGVKPERPTAPCPHCLPCGICTVCKAVPPPKVDGERPLPLQALPPINAVVVRTAAALRCALYNHVQQGPTDHLQPFDNGVDLDRCLVRLLLAWIKQLEERNTTDNTRRGASAPPANIQPPTPTLCAGDVNNPPAPATEGEEEPFFQILTPPEMSHLFRAIVGENQAGFTGEPSVLFNLVSSLLDDTITNSAFNGVPRDVLTASYARIKVHFQYHLSEQEQQCQLRIKKLKSQVIEGENALANTRVKNMFQNDTIKTLRQQHQQEVGRRDLLEKEIEALRVQLEAERRHHSTDKEQSLRNNLCENESKLRETEQKLQRALALGAAATAAEKRHARDRKWTEKEL